MHILNSIEGQKAHFVRLKIGFEATQGRTFICQIKV